MLTDYILKKKNYPKAEIPVSLHRVFVCGGINVWAVALQGCFHPLSKSWNADLLCKIPVITKQIM